MEWILLFPLGAFISLFVSGLVVAGWMSISLLFGVSPPTPPQVQGVMLGVLTLSQIGVGTVMAMCLWDDLRS